MTATDSTYLLGLADRACTDRTRVGAKAAALAVLVQGGFAVPDALVLTVDGFDAGAGVTVPEVVERALIRAAAHFESATLAVRSSALDEDDVDASRAGHYLSMLGVVGAVGLHDAVLRCWLSGSDGRPAPVRMAVLVQRQILPTAAGVAFTLNPGTGERDVVVIEAVAGLSGASLAGREDPERWEARSGAVPVRLPGQTRVLDAATAGRIADLARRVARDRGRPVDVEWALDPDGLWLLQAWPVTAIPAIEPVPIATDVPDGYWTRESVHAPRPHTPMNRSILNPRRAQALRRAFADSGILLETIDFRDIGGWEYVRLVPPGGRDTPTPPGALFALLLRLHPALRRKVAAARDEVTDDLPLAQTRRWYAGQRGALAARMAHLRDAELAALTDEALDRHRAAVVSYMDDSLDLHFELQGTQAEPLYTLVTACRDLLGWTDAQACDLVAGLSPASTEPARRLGELAQRVGADSRLRELLDRPDALTRLTAADSEVGRLITAFRREDGFRALRYEVAEPTLGERDDVVAQLIRDHLHTGLAGAQAAVTLRREAAEAQARQALAHRSEADRRRFETALRRAATVYPVREDNEVLTVGAMFALARTVGLAYGRRLAGRGQLAAAGDVFFLELDEMRCALGDGIDRSDLVLRRKGEQAWALAHPGPPSYGTPPGPPPSLRWAPHPLRLVNESVLWYTERDLRSPPASGSAPGMRRLPGIAASPGRYTGPARIILDETQLHHIRPGDVVVCPVTSPVWSVVFASMGALVTDAGGVLSHPAIIAREYHVPAVVATGNATTVLHDGDQVTVDGWAATVEIGRSG